ncbi:MAG: outer membrane beta-barrel domain-containing protein [Archangium sp.]|nr:outer membrane beta-barrel domain-containing protein [Archangium sp.]
MTSFRNVLLFAAFVTAFAVQAAAPIDAPLTVLAQATPDDDEDDPAPAATPAPTTTPKSDAPTAPPPPGTATPAPDAPAAADPEAQRLVSGAPLYNPNVAVHIVEQKAYSDSKKSEIVLYPVAMQVNGKFTQHFGTMGSFVYHLQENFGLQISGGYNWYNVESAFNGELVEKFRVEAQAATSLLWTWGVMGGVEVSPLYGKFTLFEGTLAHFSFVLNGGVGAGGTRHQLKPEGATTPASYGDTGVRFMGSLGAGFRLQLGERFAVRLEVRDVVYTARMSQVNGCNLDDLRIMDEKIRRGGKESDLEALTTLSGSCRVGTFTEVQELPDGTVVKAINNVPLALNLVKTPSSDVLNNIGMYLGISFLF